MERFTLNSQRSFISQSLFLDVIDVEPDVNRAVFAEVFGDVGFEEKLEFRSHVAGAGVAHLIVPEDALGFVGDL